MQALGADGAPIGTPLVAPSLAGTQLRPAFTDQSPAASGRIGAPGVFLAYVDYTDPTKLLLWRAGEPLPAVAGTAESRVRRPVLAATPDGQLWLAWVAGERRHRPSSRPGRSAPTARRWGRS